MAIPVNRILPIALRVGAVVAAGYAVTRAVAVRSHPGRTDQRAEDALDDLQDGLSIHRPADRADDNQANTAIRLRRTLHWRGEAFEIDAGLLGRFRMRKI